MSSLHPSPNAGQVSLICSFPINEWESSQFWLMHTEKQSHHDHPIANYSVAGVSSWITQTSKSNIADFPEYRLQKHRDKALKPLKALHTAWYTGGQVDRLRSVARDWHRLHHHQTHSRFLQVQWISFWRSEKDREWKRWKMYARRSRMKEDLTRQNGYKKNWWRRSDAGSRKFIGKGNIQKNVYENTGWLQKCWANKMFWKL